MLHLQMLASLIFVLCAHAQLPQQPLSEQEHVTNFRSQSAPHREQRGNQESPWRKDQRRVFAWMRSFLQDIKNARVRKNHHNPSLSLQSSASSRQIKDSSLADPGALHTSPDSPHSSLHPFSLQTGDTEPAGPLLEGRSTKETKHDHTGQHDLRHAESPGMKPRQHTPPRTEAAVPNPASMAFGGDADKTSLLGDSLLIPSPVMGGQVPTNSSGIYTALSSSPSSTHHSPSHPLPNPPRDSAAVPEKRSHHSDSEGDTLKGRHTGGANVQAEEYPINVEQRSPRCQMPDVLVGDEDLPWTCRQRFAWRHLGEHVYPSRLYETVCEGRSCWYGHFNCTPITYTVFVLQTCGFGGCLDHRVPSPLRSRWQWTNVNVTVGCQCMR